MKKILNLLLIIIFFVVLNILSTADQQIGPKIAMDEISFNFNEIYEGDDIEHTFKVFNQGETVLIIEKVETG